MYFEYKAKGKWNKREGVLLGGTILGRFEWTKKRIKNHWNRSFIPTNSTLHDLRTLIVAWYTYPNSKAYKQFAKDIEDERLTPQQLRFCLHQVANEYSIVLCSPKQDLYAASDLLITAYDRVQFPCFAIFVKLIPYFSKASYFPSGSATTTSSKEALLTPQKRKP